MPGSASTPRRKPYKKNCTIVNPLLLPLTSVSTVRNLDRTLTTENRLHVCYNSDITLKEVAIIYSTSVLIEIKDEIAALLIEVMPCTEPLYGIPCTAPLYGMPCTAPLYGIPCTAPLYGILCTAPLYGILCTAPLYGILINATNNYIQHKIN